MGIAPAAVLQAKKEGFEKGKEGRKIVGMSSGTQGAGGGGFRKVSKEEYMAMDSEAKAKYDKDEM